MISDEEIERIIPILESSMESNPVFANRKWSEDYVRVWLAGEIALAEFTGVIPDFRSKYHGDGGTDSYIDIVINNAMKRKTINVKTSKKPYNLVAEPGRSKADIYMLAHYFSETRRARIIGWQWSQIIHQCPTKKLTDDGVPLHVMPFHELRDIRVLSDKMVKTHD